MDLSVEERGKCRGKHTQAQKHTPKTRQATRTTADPTHRCAETKAVTRVQLCPLRPGKEASPERCRHRQSQEKTQTRQGSLRDTEEHRQCETFPVNREQRDDPDRPMRHVWFRDMEVRRLLNC